MLEKKLTDDGVAFVTFDTIGDFMRDYMGPGGSIANVIRDGETLLSGDNEYLLAFIKRRRHEYKPSYQRFMGLSLIMHYQYSKLDMGGLPFISEEVVNEVEADSKKDGGYGIRHFYRLVETNLIFGNMLLSEISTWPEDKKNDVKRTTGEFYSLFVRQYQKKQHELEDIELPDDVSELAKALMKTQPHEGQSS